MSCFFFQILKSKLETVSAEHCHACEELNRLQLELDLLKREREEFAVRTKELDMGSYLSNNLQVLFPSFFSDEESYFKWEKGKIIVSIPLLIDHITLLTGSSRPTLNNYKGKG